MKIINFGKLSNGESTGLYVLMNSNGMVAEVTDFGASLVSLIVPDKKGRKIDVVLGHDDAAGYENGHGHLGATVGRVANRIGNARIELNGKEYLLTANNGTNCLHGGRDFYNKRLWKAVIPFGKISSGSVAAKVNAVESMNDGLPAYVQSDINGESITFSMESPDGDQGFPGNLHVEVTYTLTNENELHIDYTATCDSDTALNLTNHSYFNLNGQDSGSVLEQVCQIRADQFTPSDAGLLPTGDLWDVSGTPMDFREPKTLGRDINEAYEPLQFAGGYDHNYVIRGWDNSAETGAEGMCEYREAAALYSIDSGIRMTVLTDLPGMQLYTANGLNQENGKDGVVYSRQCAVCFETQFWPDAINKERFPGGILKAGEKFHSRTTYRFD